MRPRSRVQRSDSTLRRTALVLALCSLLAIACGDSSPEPVSAPPPPAFELGNLTGIYKVSGTTRRLDGTEERRISGTVRVVHEGDRYTSTYDLETTFPGPEAHLKADVIGTGEGRAESGRLTGTAETQLVVSTVPGVDPGFAFVPRRVGVRIMSVSTAMILADGTVTMQVENSPGEGESYSPTRTVLKGERVVK